MIAPQYYLSSCIYIEFQGWETHSNKQYYPIFLIWQLYKFEINMETIVTIANAIAPTKKIYLETKKLEGLWIKLHPYDKI